MENAIDILRNVWKHRDGAIVLTTVDGRGQANSIYATCSEMTTDGRIVVADNYFDKTRANILGGSTAVVLFITDEGTSYQMKGRISYETSGDNFDFMKSWNPVKHPGHAATVISVEELYSGSKKLL